MPQQLWPLAAQFFGPGEAFSQFLALRDGKLALRPLYPMNRFQQVGEHVTGFCAVYPVGIPATIAPKPRAF